MKGIYKPNVIRQEMTDNKNKTAMLLRMSRQVRHLIDEFEAKLKNLVAENRTARICGSWIGLDGNYCLLIRKSGNGYAAMLCDNSRLYKIIVMETELEYNDGILSIPGRDETSPSQAIGYRARHDRLRFGEYGLFEPEEVVLRRTDAYRCEEPFAPDEIIY